MPNPHPFIYTIGFPNTPELYQVAGERSKLSTNPPYAALVLTKPLVTYNNPINTAVMGTRYGALIVRQYDLAGILIRQVEYRDIFVTKFDISAPELVLEFTYKP